MKTSSGNALFLVLIAVAMFAALSYALTQSGRGGSGVDKEQAEIGAARIMNHFAELDTAIQRLKITKGIPDHKIDFYTTARLLSDGSSSTYDNTNCITTECEVYASEGGGAIYRAFNDLALPNDSSWTATTAPGQAVPLIVKIVGVGSDLAELTVYHLGMDENLCKAVNRKMELPEEPQFSLAGETWYSAAGDTTVGLAASDNWTFGDDFADLVGATTFCILYSTSPRNWLLWHVVLPR